MSNDLIDKILIYERREKLTSNNVDEQNLNFLSKFAGAWEGDESAEQIIANIRANKSIY